MLITAWCQYLLGCEYWLYRKMTIYGYFSIQPIIILAPTFQQCDIQNHVIMSGAINFCWTHNGSFSWHGFFYGSQLWCYKGAGVYVRKDKDDHACLHKKHNNVSTYNNEMWTVLATNSMNYVFNINHIVNSITDR